MKLNQVQQRENHLKITESIFYAFFVLIILGSKKDFNISSAELVLERTEKITKEYTMLNPPLGKG